MSKANSGMFNYNRQRKETDGNKEKHSYAPCQETKTITATIITIAHNDTHVCCQVERVGVSGEESENT
jgi:hypothetical protein